MLSRCKNILCIRRLTQKQISWYASLPENTIKNLRTKPNQSESNQKRIINEDEQYQQLFQKMDPDAFGTLTSAAPKERQQDEGDIKEETYLENINVKTKRLTTKQYADLIKAYTRKRQIKEAIDVMEVTMIKEDKVKPEAYIYNLLMGACGRVGYTKKGFKLFNDMKKRGLTPTNGTYTALFNACANSPWIDDGLARATQLRELVIEKGVILNDTNYNAMIKAFGRCGDLQTAFNLVDEMKEKRIPITKDTLNFLLQSCISDKDAGFRHALLVWRKYYKKGITADIYSFNLMLKCIKDCNLGDAKVMDNLLKSPEFQLLNTSNELNTPESNLLPTNDTIPVDFELDTINRNKTQIFNKLKSDYELNNKTTLLNHQMPQINENESNLDPVPAKLTIIDQQSKEAKLAEVKMTAAYWPNLMAATPHLGTMLKLDEITKAEDRLLLVGGYSGFLNTMKHFHVKPDIKTFTMLLDCIPGTIAAEKALITTMKREGVKLDVDFLNMLIKKRSMRFDYENAKDVISMFDTLKLRPDVVTYGILALGCETRIQAENLINEMRNAGYRMNIEILGPMLRQGCIRFNFKYVLEIMELALTEQIKPNKMFIQHLEDFYKKCKIESKVKNGDFFTKGFRLFRMRYETWLKEIEMEPKENMHPWQQFRQRTETKVTNYKDTEIHFKPKLLSRYRQKTSTKNSYRN